MSVRYYVACTDCEQMAFVDKAAQIYNATGAEIWIDHPPHLMDVAELVLFIRYHTGHRIGFYPDNDDPVLGEMMEWGREERIPSRLHRKYNKKHGFLANPDRVDVDGNWIDWDGP
jgi:hypothetical protein